MVMGLAIPFSNLDFSGMEITLRINTGNIPILYRPGILIKFMGASVMHPMILTLLPQEVVTQDTIVLRGRALLVMILSIRTE